MATINSNNENLIFNADGSGNDIIFQSNGTQVGSLSDSGVFTTTSYTGDGASLTGMASNINSMSDSTISASDPATDSNPSAVGHLWVNSTSGETYICTDVTTDSNVWTNTGDGDGDVEVISWYGSRGIIAGNNSGSGDIQYVTIQSTGNSSTFGNLTSYRGPACISNRSRAVFMGGSPGVMNIMDYVTVATTGDATDFGDLTAGGGYGTDAVSNGIRGVRCGAYNPAGPGYDNTLDYITISTTGNATDFGDNLAPHFSCGACSNSVRGVLGNGEGGTSGAYDQYQLFYITIATTSNSSTFGNLTHAGGQGRTAIESETRGIFGGGRAPLDNGMEYITVATTGNATDFGDFLVGGRRSAGTCGDGSRGLWSGGDQYPSPGINVIEYITIATTGNATDFGDLSVGTSGHGTSGQ